MTDVIGIHTSGLVESLTSSEYDTLREFVGGYLETLTSSDGRLVLWFNEDGRLFELATNPVATALLWQVAPQFRPNTKLVGRVAVTGASGEDDSIAPIPQEIVELLSTIKVPR